jgi:hypothetical protein
LELSFDTGCVALCIQKTCGMGKTFTMIFEKLTDRCDDELVIVVDVARNIWFCWNSVVHGEIFKPYEKIPTLH